MRDADQKGVTARAWLIDEKRWPDSPTFIGAWMVKGEPVGEIPLLTGLPAIKPACAFNAAWDTWLIQACHLRDVEGMPPAKLHYPEAEYEITILALDPRQGPFDPDQLPTQLPFLEPVDLVKQFHGCSDEQVRRMLGLMVREICAGRMSPDSDYRRAWERTIDSTVEHYKAGLHPQD
jgi:hypothetical protein